MKAVNIVLTISVMLLVGTISTPDVNAYNYEVKPDHPRVDFLASEVPALALRAGNTHSTEYAGLKSWCDAYMWDDVNAPSNDYKGWRASAYAFVYLIETELGNDGTTYSGKAKDYMNAISGALATWSDHDAKKGIARAYDWIYPELSAAEKAAFTAKMAVYIDVLLAATTNSGTSGVSGSHAPLVHMGLAIYDENSSKATEALDKAFYWMADTNNPYRILDNWNEVGSDGTLFSGSTYQYLGTIKPAEWVWAWDKGTNGEEFAPSFTHLQNLPLFYIYSSPPDWVSQPHADGRLWPSDSTNKQCMYILASLYDDGLAQWLGDQCSTNSGRDTWWHYIVWHDKSIDATAPTSLDKYKWFDIGGHAYMRSGWDMGSTSTDLYARFKCTKRDDAHSHLDQNSFVIFRGDDALAIQSGIENSIRGSDPPGQHHYDYKIRTVAHNSVLVYNPGADPLPGYKNDGGQTSISTRPGFSVGSRLPGSNYYRGLIERGINAEHYCYSYADATPSYSDTGNDSGSNVTLDNFTRQFLYLKDRFFVVFDRVNSLDASYSKSWLLHSIETPAIEDGGSWNGGTPPNAHGGTPGQTSSNTNVLSVAEGNSKLYINILYPENHMTTRAGGPDSNGNYNNENSFEFYHRGSNDYSTYRDAEAEHGRWRIEVSPSGVDVRRGNIFLHVLEPVDSAASGTETARVEDTTNGFYGVHIKHATEPWVVMFSEAETLGGIVAYTITAAETIKHLICDLESGDYIVKKNGVAIPGSPFAVTSASTLYFEVYGGGSFEVTQCGTILINGGDEYTDSPIVTLTLSPPDPGGIVGPITEMMFRNENLDWSSAQPYSNQHTWELSSGDGEKTVFVKFKDAEGNWTEPVSDSITLDTIPPSTPGAPIVGIGQ